MGVYVFDEFRFDSTEKQLWLNSQIVALQPKAAEILTIFLQNNNKLLSRDELMQEVWKDTYVEESNLRFGIHSLRKILGKRKDGKDYIETVPKRGYRFNAEVKEVTENVKNSLSRYEILEKIGVGGMGEVFLAFDSRLERNVALKVLLPEIAQDKERIKRFKLEAKAVSALNHPNIVSIFDIGEDKEKLFITYELIEGITLREKIKRSQFTVEDSINIAEQVAKALSSAHQAKIIHRDVKPENIMIRNDGYVKILDFGLAKRTPFSSMSDEETLEWVTTQKGVILGSIQYMSPEQSRGFETDEKTDIWSLGVVLYEMLTGKNPFEGETISDSVAAILHFEPESIGSYLSNFPKELAWIIEKSLQTDLSKRYQHMKDFATDLKKVRKTLGKDILSRQVIFEETLEKTVEFYPRVTDEKKIIQEKKELQNLQKNEIENEVLFEKKKRDKRWILIPIAAVVLLGIIPFYNLVHPFLFPNYYAKFQKAKVTKLTNDGLSSKAAISDDGKWVAFVKEQNGKKDLISRELATGNEKLLDSVKKGEILQPTFNSIDSFLGLRDFGYVYYVKKDGAESGTLYSTNYRDNFNQFFGGLKVLPNVDSRISFSPDGQKYAFIRKNGEEKGDSIIIASSALSIESISIKEKISTKDTNLTEFTSVAWQNADEDFTINGTTRYKDGSGSGEVYETSKSSPDKSFVPDLANQIEWIKDGSKFSLGSIKSPLYVESPDYYNSATSIDSETYNFTSFDTSKDGQVVVISGTKWYPSVWTFNQNTKENKQILDENTGIYNLSELKQTSDGKLLFEKINIEKPEELIIKNLDNNANFIPKISKILLMDSDGTNQSFLNCEDNNCKSPILSPDGKYIFYEYRDFNTEKKNGIWRVNIDGSNLIQLTEGWDSYFQITPDNKTIVFSRYDSRDHKLMKVSIDGEEVVELAESVYVFTILPNGKILYKKDVEKGSEIVGISLDTNESEVFAKDEDRISSFVAFNNGKNLVYRTYQSDRFSLNSQPKSKLRLISLDKVSQNKIIGEMEFDGHFSFKISPDEKWIYYLKLKGRELFRFPINSNSLEPQSVEQVMQVENGRIRDIIWSQSNNELIYLLDYAKSDVFLIENAE